MARYVISPDVALHLASHGSVIAAGHRLLAPTLFRSQLLSRLYQAVRSGELTGEAAERQLRYVRELGVRLLGDRVLQRAAWQIAEQLGLSDTFDAEYVALTRLQADALITLDASLARAVEGIVATASIEALS